MILTPRGDHDARIATVQDASNEGTPAESYNTRYWRDAGITWGGYFGTAKDVLRFATSFLPGRDTVLSPESVREMTSDQADGIPGGVESMGAIQDRTREHLASSDKAIAANRRLLFRAMEAVERGERPLMALDPAAAGGVTGPATMDGIGPTEGWEAYWPEVDRRRRHGAPWARLAAE